MSSRSSFIEEAKFQGSGSNAHPPAQLGGAFAWCVWSVAATFLLFQFAMQLSSGEIITNLMSSFHLTALGGGTLASSYYYVYVVLQIPAGILMDRYGPRRLLSLGALVCMLGCYLFATAHWLVMAFLGRILMGAGSAFAFVGSLYLISHWFPRERFAFIVGIAEALGMGGSIVGGVGLAYVLNHFGWRLCMLGAALIAGVLALLIWLVVRDQPEGGQPEVVEHLEIGSLGQELKRLFKNPQAWANGLYSGFMYSVISVFISLWAIPFVRLLHGLSLIQASWACDMAFIGIAIGSPLIGWLDLHTRHRRKLLLWTGILNLAIIVFFIYGPTLPYWLLMLSMTLLGVACTGYVLPYAIAHDMVPAKVRSASIGLTNTLSVGIAPLLQPLVGFFLFLSARHHVLAGVQQYSVTDYKWALGIIPLAIVLALALIRFIPRKPKKISLPH